MKLYDTTTEHHEKYISILKDDFSNDRTLPMTSFKITIHINIPNTL
jgi:hypothetical protein